MDSTSGFPKDESDHIDSYDYYSDSDLEDGDVEGTGVVDEEQTLDPPADRTTQELAKEEPRYTRPERSLSPSSHLYSKIQDSIVTTGRVRKVKVFIVKDTAFTT